MAWGLSGVKKGNEKKVFDLIQSAVEKVYEEGLSEDDINSAIMGIDFNLREVGRHFGPFSIVLMSKALAGWTNGLEPKAHLSPISDFEIVKQNLASDPDYTKKLIKKYRTQDSIKLITYVTESFTPVNIKNFINSNFI